MIPCEGEILSNECYSKDLYLELLITLSLYGIEHFQFQR